jgi:hypothetical protein
MRRIAVALARQAAAEAWSEAEQVNIAGSREQ